jgi:hypothetical protein
MPLEFSSIRPITTTEPNTTGWEHLRDVIGAPPPVESGNTLPPPESELSEETLRSTLIELGTTVNKANLALAEALAKLGVPLTESNMLEGQILLARLPGTSPSAYALSKALDLPPTPAVLQALSAVVERQSDTSRLDLDTLDVLSLLPQPGLDDGPLADYITKLFEKLGQSTENKLLADSDNSIPTPLSDIRSSLLGLASTEGGGQISEAADRHAAFIEGQQILNQVAVQKFDNTVPLYFAFPMSLAFHAAECEVQVWSAKDKKSKDARAADQEEYLHATVRIEAERLGTIETSLTGMWSGRLLCTMYAAKAVTHRLLKRETPSLASTLAGLGWNVAPIEVVRQEHFTPLWLGGLQLDNPRQRVDRRI